MPDSKLRQPFTRQDPFAADLRDLATRLAREIAAAEAAPPEGQPRALVFRVGPLALALPLTAIREVVLTPDRLSRVPRAPEALLGIMNLRGRVVTVVDLAHALPDEVAVRLLHGQAADEPGADLKDGRILILQRGSHEIGLLVRTVEGIATLPAPDSHGLTLLDPEKVQAAIDALVA